MHFGCKIAQIRFAWLELRPKNDRTQEGTFRLKNVVGLGFAWVGWGENFLLWGGRGGVGGLVGGWGGVAGGVLWGGWNDRYTTDR